MVSDGLYLPDTPEGRAVEICAAAISDNSTEGQHAQVRKLTRIAFFAMIRLAGAEQTSQFFARLSRDALEMRGLGRGRTGAF